ncbi:MAG: tetratricopeptide repeat protein [Candidatus Tectomicrobia bacterium]|nr:tetratricopeptide repeat protein [Candidatus Tectomicrobia bacterium]
MPVRFLLTCLLPLAGGLYLLFLNAGDIQFTLAPGRAWRVPLVVVVLGSALIGALGAGFSDLSSHLAAGWRKWREARALRRHRKSEASYQAGLAALASGDARDARRAFHHALRQDPAHQNALLACGDLERRLGNLSAAFALHRKALQAGADDLELMASFSDDLASAGRTDALRALGERARQAGRGEAIPMLRLRDYHISRGEWEAAVDVQETLLRLPGETRDEDGRRLLANLLYEAGRRRLESGRVQEGMHFFRRALRADGRCVPAHVALGDAHRSAGESLKAIRAWLDGYDRLPASIFIRRLLSMLDTSGAADEVLRALRKEARKRPSDDRLRFALAEACLREGRPSDALAESDHLSPPARRTEPARTLRARALLDLGNPADARAELSAGSLESPGFRCSACSEGFERWAGRCPSCGRWGTLDETEGPADASGLSRRSG